MFLISFYYNIPKTIISGMFLFLFTITYQKTIISGMFALSLIKIKDFKKTYKALNFASSY